MSHMRHNHTLKKWINTEKIWLKQDILNKLKEHNLDDNKKDSRKSL